MRIWYASIFLSLLAGKFCPFEQSAGVSRFMEIFSNAIIVRSYREANIEPAHVYKVKSET